MTLYQYGPIDGTIPTRLGPSQSIEQTHVAGTPPSADGFLAETGSDLLNLAGIGVIVLLVGLGLSNRARRRSTQVRKEGTS